MKIAIVGGGTVGGGVVEMLQSWPAIDVAYIVVRDLTKTRDFAIPTACTVTDSTDLVLADKSVDVVLELMGGTDKAWELVRTCLSRGTHVVTANKALISKYLPEIESILAKFDGERRPKFMYEAAVCGGIPVIHTFLRGFRGDKVKAIQGVMNGSTNWMLEKMFSEGASYASLLGEAKQLGYLEADPSADVLGWDTRSKLCILARIGLGCTLDESKVVCHGIDSLNQFDIAHAMHMGKRIRLLAQTWVDSENVAHAFVFPAMVPVESRLGNLPGATNCVTIDAKFSGAHCLVGSGAGRYPTANSVVADILDIHASLNVGESKVGCFGSLAGNAAAFSPDFEATFYVRAPNVETLEDVMRMVEAEKIVIKSKEKDTMIIGPCEYSRIETILNDKSKVASALVVM